MKSKLVTSLALVVGFVVIGVPLFAHHGTGVAYDTEKQVTMKGTVTEWIWANPHCGVLFDVTDDKDNVVHWGARANQSARTVSGRLQQGYTEAWGQDHDYRAPLEIRCAAHLFQSYRPCRWPGAPGQGC